jgi:hypothetical protein
MLFVIMASMLLHIIIHAVMTTQSIPNKLAGARLFRDRMQHRGKMISQAKTET